MLDNNYYMDMSWSKNSEYLIVTAIRREESQTLVKARDGFFNTGKASIATNTRQVSSVSVVERQLGKHSAIAAFAINCAA